MYKAAGNEEQARRRAIRQKIDMTINDRDDRKRCIIIMRSKNERWEIMQEK
jgi:hypothetical protein